VIQNYPSIPQLLQAIPHFVLHIASSFVLPYANFTLNFPKLFFRQMHLYLRDYSSQDHENLQYVWIVFEKLLAFFENPKLINKVIMYFSVRKCRKILIVKKNYKNFQKILR
jgi:hypothetical protein